MKMAVAALTSHDAEYPALLREIHRPPSPLFTWGKLDLSDRLIVAIVGSRKATSYGLAAVKTIVEPLAQSGVVVVSGLALGIDSAAHRATLRVGGVTLAVLGTPLARIYPVIHQNLAREIVDNGGAVVSEYDASAQTHKSSFVLRNRIIAGLAHATVVVEAALESGSLITARAALEENREVFAVPGPITSSYSAGTNNLLKLGARPATSADDILVALGKLPLSTQAISRPRLAKGDENLLQLIPLSEPIHIDKLLESVTIGLPDLQSSLTILELQGYVRMVQPGWFLRVR